MTESDVEHLTVQLAEAWERADAAALAVLYSERGFITPSRSQVGPAQR